MKVQLIPIPAIMLVVLGGTFSINNACFLTDHLHRATSFTSITNPSLKIRNKYGNVLTRLRALDIKVRIVGKQVKSSDQRWIEDAAGVYEKRVKPNGLGIQTIWHKKDDELVKGVEMDKTKGSAVVYLDPSVGRQCTSEDFSKNLYKWFEEGGSRVTFVIGGAEGLPPSLREQAAIAGRKKGFNGLSNSLSLSDMTFTHQFARMLLMEQIYRASEIRKGSGKHV